MPTGPNRSRVRMAWLPSGSPRGLRGVRGVALRAAAALAVGVSATAATTLVPLWWHERGRETQRTAIYRREYGWVFAYDEVFSVRWTNLQLLPERLLTPLDAGDIPSWAEPPAPPYSDTDLFRVATLAAGWPLPWLRARWVASEYTHAFPVPAEIDEGDTSLVYAAEDLLHGTRAGGPTELGVLWPGLLLDVLVFAALWAGPVRLAWRIGRHLRAGRGVTRPEDAAGAR